MNPNASAAAENWNLRDPAQLLATGFGVGLLPVVPGTWASLFALPAAWGIITLAGQAGLAIAAASAFVIGIWAAGACVEKQGIPDPGPVVIDEIAGQWAVLLFVPVDLIHYGIGFVLFRAFDIFKPWPVGWADREVKGGLGIMLDDVLAAVYAALVLWGVAWVMPQALGG
jgi:phosphatidylglycerophosphatase A